MGPWADVPRQTMMDEASWAPPLLPPAPTIITSLGNAAAQRYDEFFSASTRSPATTRAYARACWRFFDWCAARNLTLQTLSSFHVEAYIDELNRGLSTITVKQHLIAVRTLSDWLVTGGIIAANPASGVRALKSSGQVETRALLEGASWQGLIKTMPTSSVRDIRDRALIATLTYSFPRLGAALAMRVEDFGAGGAGWELRFGGKGGRAHVAPAHEVLVGLLQAYLDAAEIREDLSGWLFRTTLRRGSGFALSRRPIQQIDAVRMIRKRAVTAGVVLPIGEDFGRR